jgi:uncharacterized protein YkwD
MDQRSRGARVLVPGVAAVVALVMVMTLARSAHAATWYASARPACAQSRHLMRCYTNETRRLAGRPRLYPSAALQQSAQEKGRRIVRCRDLSHTPCGDPWLRPFFASGYLPAPGRWLAGENLAWGWGSTWQAFAALMHSPAHRANILDPGYADIGVRGRRSPWGRLWVVHFGRR